MRTLEIRSTKDGTLLERIKNVAETSNGETGLYVYGEASDDDTRPPCLAIIPPAADVILVYVGRSGETEDSA